MPIYNDSPFCACSTPAGVSGIAVIRISGDKTSEAVDKVTRIIRSSGSFKTFSELPGYTAAYADFINPDNGSVIDKVIITRFVAPYSYTGDEMAEISCHGSTAVKQEILDSLSKVGIRAAGPGEFTKQAFINGKLSLSAAEAVMDVISSDSEKALEAANVLVQGELSRLLTSTEEKLYKAMALIEMIVEFPEHDDTPENEDQIKAILKTERENINKLCKSFGKGRLLSERMKVALAGLPNAGKSSLLNCLSGYDRAIVTEVAGTTRDTLEVQLNIEGVPVTLVDTAGIRRTEDKIEAIGVNRAISAIDEADLVFYMVSPDTSIEVVKEQFSELSLENKKAVILFSKSDSGSNPDENEIKEFANTKGITEFLNISSSEGINIDSIREVISRVYEEADGGISSQIILTNRRHYECLSESLAKLDMAIDALENDMGVDICSSVVRLSLDRIGEITGKTVSASLADTIFSGFCIGK